MGFCAALLRAAGGAIVKCPRCTLAGPVPSTPGGSHIDR